MYQYTCRCITMFCRWHFYITFLYKMTMLKNMMQMWKYPVSGQGKDGVISCTHSMYVHTLYLYLNCFYTYPLRTAKYSFSEEIAGRENVSIQGNAGSGNVNPTSILSTHIFIPGTQHFKHNIL